MSKIASRASSKPANDNPKPCPICAKPSGEKYRPFCCKRCADVDLHRWLGGQYAIPASDDGPSSPGEEEG